MSKHNLRSREKPQAHAQVRSRELTGVVKRHPDGFGFLIPDDDQFPDTYIARHGMMGIMSNDRVRIRAFPERGRDRWYGEVVEILERSTKRVAGKYSEKKSGEGWLFDHSFAWGADLKINPDHSYNVKPGEWVSVQIDSYPDSEQGFCGTIIAVIGDLADPMNDNLRMLHTHSIPYGFSKKAQAEAERIPDHVSDADMAGRKDLRSLGFITIDGKTAKDFDDAVYTEADQSGFHLWVAIADVSHYVKPGSAIDLDAYERGTSTYFPNFVSPMLPEKLSNELCSLKPKVPRLAFVAEMHLNFQGELVQSEFYEAVIQSQARVTYGEAQEVLDGEVAHELTHVADNIRRCADLAKVLMAKRFKEGSLDLEIPETEIEIDDRGQPVDIMQSERLFAHRLIEELMLSANVAVAKYFKQRSSPGIYRIHEPPVQEAIENFANFIHAFGYKQKLSGGHLQKKISRALEFFHGHAKEHILHVLALRSMSQAQYSANNVGHFGLGFADYTHFTSPIRRYPDLLVHRQMKALLVPRKGYALASHESLESAGVFLSACEQRSVKAERQIRAVKRARFMHQHVGESFSGIISSVTKFGVFVLLRQFDIDGLVHVEDLGGDHFEFDVKNLRLVGRRSGFTYVIGEPLHVTVAKVDIERGQIDFVLAEENQRAVTRPPQKQSIPQRRPAQEDRRGLRKKRLPRRRR